MRIWVLVWLLAGGCLESAVIECADGTRCPASQVCAPAGGSCVNAEQLLACAELDEGAACTLPAVGEGTCRAAICMVTGCGDGVVDEGEACDDGNQTSADGCRADCRKIEVCGDALVDEGEACDDGNQNAADGCDACAATRWSARVLVGGTSTPARLELGAPNRVAVDARGNVYIASDNRVRRVEAGTGMTTTVVGTGRRNPFPTISGDGTPAANVDLDPAGIAIDGRGNLYIADDQERVRKVDAQTGLISTLAGTGTAGYGGDGSDGKSALVNRPSGIAVDGFGNVYVADSGNHRVRRIDGQTGVISTLAGTGTTGFSGDNGPASAAQLATPEDVAVDRLGNVYIADRINHRVRKVTVAASPPTITTVAGTGVAGFAGDGGQAKAAQLYQPWGVWVDAAGTLFIADNENQRVRRVDTAGVITTIAGTGEESFSGDGFPAVGAALSTPIGVACDAGGNLYIADSGNNRVRRVDAAGTITTFAGTGSRGYSGEGGAGTSAAALEPHAVLRDAAGNLYYGEARSGRVRRLDAVTRVLSTVAGTGTPGFSGDGGPASAARLGAVTGLALDTQGNLYVAEEDNARVRRIDVAGVITTVAGTGVPGFSGDGGLASAATLRAPGALAVDASGNLYIADAGNHRIRRVAAGTGLIATIAGSSSTGGFGGDGGAATSALLNGPVGIALDSAGNLIIADTTNNRIRRVAAAGGVITTIAGTGTASSSGDGGPATSATVRRPEGVAVDGTGRLYIAETGGGRIRRVGTDGTIATVAGEGSLGGFGGDGGPATSPPAPVPPGPAPLLYEPSAVVPAPNGDFYLADSGTFRIRRVSAAGIITTVVGPNDPEGMGPAGRASFKDPRALVVTPELTFIAGGTSGTLQFLRQADAWVGVGAGRYPHNVEVASLARFRNSYFGTVGGVAYDPVNRRVFLSETASDPGRTAHVVHVVTVVDPADELGWTIATLGDPSGAPGYLDGPLATARFRNPSGLHYAADTQVLYVADTGNHVVRAIDLPAGTVRTVAGTPEALGFFGDGGSATAALLFRPRAVTRCPNGDLFVSDTGNQRVRRIDSGSLISTVLGDGAPASSGEGAPSSAFSVAEPAGLACDAAGNLFITSSTAVRMLPADDTTAHVVDGTGPVQTIFGAAPRTSFPASVSFCLSGLALPDATTVQVTDACTGMLISLNGAPRLDSLAEASGRPAAKLAHHACSAARKLRCELSNAVFSRAGILASLLLDERPGGFHP